MRILVATDGSEYAGAGLRAGDVIVCIGDVRVEDAAGSSRT
jgi:hypothetical protein